jgi:cell pole-organizing protein PopZ
MGAFPLGFSDVVGFTRLARLITVFVDESGVPKPIGPRFGVDLEAVMNKPAPKEPSMDEILSSIRQIIADDDAGAAPRKPIVPPAASLQAAPAPTPRPIPNLPPMTRQPEPEPDPEPLELTTDQMVVEEQEERRRQGSASRPCLAAKPGSPRPQPVRRRWSTPRISLLSPTTLK